MCNGEANQFFIQPADWTKRKLYESYECWSIVELADKDTHMFLMFTAYISLAPLENCHITPLA